MHLPLNKKNALLYCTVLAADDSAIVLLISAAGATEAKSVASQVSLYS